MTLFTLLEHPPCFEESETYDIQLWQLLSRAQELLQAVDKTKFGRGVPRLGLTESWLEARAPDQQRTANATHSKVRDEVE